MTRSRWNILPPPPLDACQVFAGTFPPLIAGILYHRGITEASQVEPFFSADGRLSGDPALLSGMAEAVARLYRALLCGEKIAVYGDFDTDGVTATALMVEGLSLLGVKAVPFIPNRLTEGYGLKVEPLAGLGHQGVNLVISVDCGITAPAVVREAKRLGLDIIITDHHMPLGELPQAAAVVDPKLSDSSYPFSDLSGAGVAFKLLQALFRSIGKEEQLDRLFDLVALGTVADMVPLLGENRYLTTRGLKQLNESPRLGIKEIMAKTSLTAGCLDSDSISWVLAPRLNAAGRLEHAMSSYQLLTTDSLPEAQRLASWLEQKNSERQGLTEEAMEIARQQVLEAGIRPVLFASDNKFPAGICGLVASRLAGEFYHPAVVVRTGEKLSSGSCRSIPEFNIVEALNRYQSEVGGFVHFGGHAQAAGFTLPTRDLPRLNEHLCEFASRQLAGLDLRPAIDVDAEVGLSDLGGPVFPLIQKMSPFGQGNPQPTFLSRQVEVVDCRSMGNGGKHLRLKLRRGGMMWNAVAFDLGCHQSEARSPLDVVYNLEVDRWNGAETLRLNVLDFAACE